MQDFVNGQTRRARARSPVEAMCTRDTRCINKCSAACRGCDEAAVPVALSEELNAWLGHKRRKWVDCRIGQTPNGQSMKTFKWTRTCCPPRSRLDGLFLPLTRSAGRSSLDRAGHSIRSARSPIWNASTEIGRASRSGQICVFCKWDHHECQQGVAGLPMRHNEWAESRRQADCGAFGPCGRSSPPSAIVTGLARCR